MRIRWRGLELPSRVVRDENVSTDTYGRFTAEPFERGFGTTVGNALRRVLLSAIEGAAIRISDEPPSEGLPTLSFEDREGIVAAVLRLAGLDRTRKA